MISEESLALARQFEPRIAAAFDSHDDESVGAKLAREADVFGLGTISGVGSSLVDKVANPLGTVGELALGYTGARVISALERRAGFAGLVAQGVGLAVLFRKMTPAFDSYTETQDRPLLLSRLMGVGHGWSGSALVERSSGEVVGVVSSGYYNPKTRRPTISESMQGVRELLAQIT